MVDLHKAAQLASELIDEKVAQALREESAEAYRLAYERLKAIGPNPTLDWETVTDLQDYLSDAAEAMGVLRALTPMPERESLPDA